MTRHAATHAAHPAHPAHPADDTAFATAFSTSGTSGEPVLWLREPDQLRAEAALVADTVVGPVDRVLNYAPPHHLYGRIFGELLPEHLGVPVRHLWDSPLTPPDLTPGDRVLLVCLPATWLVLRGLTDRLGALPGVTAVHSSSPLTPAAHRLFADLEGSAFRAAEVYGSTETGAIAHRTAAPRPERPSLWTLLPDVRLLPGPGAEGGGEQLVHVSGPRLARRADQDAYPASLVVDDLIRPVDARRFELLGRAGRLIKVNGRRIRLDHVEQVLHAAFPHADIVCVPRRDHVRAEHYDLYHADDHGELTPDTVHAALAHGLPGVPVPRRIHRVAAVPRSATGKVRLDRLLAAARTASPTGTPHREAADHARRPTRTRPPVRPSREDGPHA